MIMMIMNMFRGRGRVKEKKCWQNVRKRDFLY
jgi:hypothetical protein